MKSGLLRSGLVVGGILGIALHGGWASAEESPLDMPADHQALIAPILSGVLTTIRQEQPREEPKAEEVVEELRLWWGFGIYRPEYLIVLRRSPKRDLVTGEVYAFWRGSRTLDEQPLLARHDVQWLARGKPYVVARLRPRSPVDWRGLWGKLTGLDVTTLSTAPIEELSDDNQLVVQLTYKERGRTYIAARKSEERARTLSLHVEAILSKHRVQ